jgi:hypothetical protein
MYFDYPVPVVISLTETNPERQTAHERLALPTHHPFAFKRHLVEYPLNSFLNLVHHPLHLFSESRPKI